jgi:hypothetical protein
MPIISPKHSLVNFEGELSDVVLPAYEYMSIGFQFLFPSNNTIPLSQVVHVALADATTSAILYNYHTAVNKCAWSRIEGIDFALDFPLVVQPSQPLSGTYDKPADLFAAIRTFYGLDCYSSVFLQCCNVDVLSSITFTAIGHDPMLMLNASINFYKGLQSVFIEDDNNSNFDNIGIQPEQCFRYALIRTGETVFSNVFKRVTDNRHITLVTYSNNEDAYGFYYPDATVQNKIWLSLLTLRPKYPEKRSVYIKSNKNYKVLNATIEKEWECKTEHYKENVHEKIGVLLSHDNIHFKNTRLDADVYKKDDYEIAWPDDEVSEEIGPASFKINVAFEGRNSNCEKRRVCGTFNPGGIPQPSLVETSRVDGVVFGLPTRTQVFDVGPNVATGNRFKLVCYGHAVEVVAISTDTPATIAQKLSNALNAATPSDWNEFGGNPAGADPASSYSANHLTIVLDTSHFFTSFAYVS